MVTFCLIIGHDRVVAHLHILLIYPSPVFVLCNKEKSIKNKDHSQSYTVLNTENNIVKIYQDVSLQMEFLQVPEHLRLLLLLIY
jgi:hypothetical protein